jgi:hypothetical protein
VSIYPYDGPAPVIITLAVAKRGGAKKQRREPFGRRQRQNSPSGDG